MSRAGRSDGDKKRDGGGDEGSPALTSSSDEELDFSSARFDAVKTLYSPRVRLGGARAFDNVERLVAAKEGRVAGTKKKLGAGPSTSSSGPPPQRQFLPEQQMVQGQRREASNVLQYMQRTCDGPLGDLSRWARDGRRVDVCTRGPRGERGRMRGALVAFDKHWNLALSDVDETFRRRRRAKTCLDGGERAGPRTEEGARKEEPKVEFVGESRVRVVKTKRNTLICQRYVPQLLVRGEHVVFVSLV